MYKVRSARAEEQFWDEQRDDPWMIIHVKILLIVFAYLRLSHICEFSGLLTQETKIPYNLKPILTKLDVSP